LENYPDGELYSLMSFKVARSILTIPVLAGHDFQGWVREMKENKDSKDKGNTHKELHMQFKRHFQDVGIGEISSAPILLTTFYSQI
jgi:hypothetical protein